MRMQILNVPCGCTFVLVCAHLCMHVLVLVAKSNTTNVTILSTPLKNTMHLSQNKNLSLSACCVGNNLRPFLIVRDASSHKINDVMTTRLTVVTGRNKVTARKGAEMIPGRSSTPRGGTRNGWMTEQRGKSSPKANPIAKWNITEEEDVLRSNAQNEANKAVVRMLNQPGAVVWIDHSQGHPFWHPLTDWGQSGCDKKQVRRKAGATKVCATKPMWRHTTHPHVLLMSPVHWQAPVTLARCHPTCDVTQNWKHLSDQLRIQSNLR